MRIPILTYQPMNVHGSTYASNHLVALAADLRQLTEAGFRIAPLSALVDAWLAGRHEELEGKVVALCSDDGADFDYRDLEHPVAGLQRSALNILRDFAAEHPGRQPQLNLTAFSIVSPEARAALDSACMLGRGWWGDEWWAEAVRGGLLHIANHSWDHNHDALPTRLSHGVVAGTFSTINSSRLADLEIRQAAAYLRSRADNPGAALFAYPYGESNSFLVEDYFPARSAEIGIQAAFTGRPGFWERDGSRWEIPRFVCGRDWRSPAGLAEILGAAADRRAWRSQSVGPAGMEGTEPGRDAFTEFLRTRVEAIPGWLHAEAALMTAHLTRAQRAHGLEGAVLEIGVFKGKYLSVLYELSSSGEPVVGVDLFVGAQDKDEASARVRANIVAACGDDARLRILVADSFELDAAKLSAAGGVERYRFVSIDGGHTRELVRCDLETAVPLLAPGGIIALDDVFNFGTPGVAEGVAGYFMDRKPALAPFAICWNKVFVTTPEFHARYLEQAHAFIDEYPWLATCRNTRARTDENHAAGFTPSLFGYEVLPFI